MADASRFWRPVAGGVEVDLRVQPGARADRVEGVVRRADGSRALKVRLKAPPAAGKANAALVQLLAKRWGLAKGDLGLVAGRTGRDKRLRLAGDPEQLAARLAAEHAAG